MQALQLWSPRSRATGMVRAAGQGRAAVGWPPPPGSFSFLTFPLQMNRATPDQERAPTSKPVWERPWSVEEIRRNSQSWSLAADAGVRGGLWGHEGKAGLPG